LEAVLERNVGTLMAVFGKAGSGKRTLINRFFQDPQKQTFYFIELDGEFNSLLEVREKQKEMDGYLKKGVS
jgi:septin family protein